MASSRHIVFDLIPRLQFNEHDETEKDESINKEKNEDSADTQTVPSERILVIINAARKSAPI